MNFSRSRTVAISILVSLASRLLLERVVGGVLEIKALGIPLKVLTLMIVGKLVFSFLREKQILLRRGG